MSTTPRYPLDRLFKPRSVAVIGASRKKGTLGWQVLHNLISFEFQGKIFPVNPGADVIHSLKCYPSVEAIDDEVDLAIIIVPAEQVLEAAEACGRKGVGGLVVISAGFKEIGGEGVEREKRLLETVRRYGMRMIGPNCMGILNSAPDVRLDAVFAEAQPVPGNVAFTSQSGALGAAVMNQAKDFGIGFSMFASMGNKCDVSINDLLEYWEADPATDVILLYLESFGNPQNFTSIARRVTRKKPVVVVKSGRTSAGARAASSHTGSLAGADVAVDAMLEQCGILRARTVEELFDVALAFSTQPIPKGRRVMVVTNGGGPAIMAVDALVSCSLELPDLPAKAREVLKKGLSPMATIANPLDLVGGARAQDYKLAFDTVLREDFFDAMIVICVPTVQHDPTDIYIAAAEAVKNTGKPVIGVFMAPENVRRRAEERRPDLPPFPVYAYPESAACALHLMNRYRDRRAAPIGTVRRFEIDRARATAAIAAARAEGRAELSFHEGREICLAYGIPFVETVVVTTPEEAADAAEKMGGPVVVKAQIPGHTHKSDVGGVVVGVQGKAAVKDACTRMIERVKTATKGQAPDAFVIQQQVKGGKETIFGIVHDPVFGATLMFGMGGVYVEVLKDVAFSIVPVTDMQAKRLVRQIRAFPLLAGVRGEASVDLDMLEETACRLSQLVTDFPAIRELDLNPFLALPAGGKTSAVDVRMRLAPE